MELLKSLYAINSKSGHEGEIKAFILSCLDDVELTIEEDNFGNLFITKGVADSYPCLTAHLDEVHEPAERVFVVDDDTIYALDSRGERTGIGADDKNGLWIIIHLLHNRPTLKAALFVQEERAGEMAGCRGSKACSLEWFDDVRYLLAVDRKGDSEVVTVSKGDIKLCDESIFPQSVLEKYGYSCVSGGRTDVTALKERRLQTPCCNISCGYYNAHKSDEYAVYSHLVKALNFVGELIDAM